MGGDPVSLADEWTWNSEIVTWNDLNVSWNGTAAILPANAPDIHGHYTTVFRRR